MNKYKSYKKVDLPWIKEIPEHWDVKRHKNIFSLKKYIIGEDSYKTDILTLTVSGIKIKDKSKKGGKIPESYDTYQIIQKNDLVLCLFDLDVSAVFSDVSKFNGIISPAYSCFEVKNGYPRFYKYIFDKIFQDRSYKIHSKSVRYTITNENFLSLSNIIPPFEEQKKIVNYLDWKINKIDRLILIEKEKIIELEKYKNSVICNLVSCGVSSYKDMKPINNHIFKKCPNHWKITTIKKVSIENKVKNTGMIEKNLLSLSYGKLKRKSLNATGLVPENFEKYKILDKDMIVLRFIDLQNDHKSLRVGLCKEKGIITSAYIALKLNNNVIPLYLYYYLHSYDISKGFYSMGTGVRQSLSYKEFSNLEIGIPPLDEQSEISKKCELLENQCINNKKIIEEKIKLLNELKQSLISQVVTGQIDVREIYIPEYEKVTNS